MAHSIFDFQIKTASGEVISMDQFKGKALLIVNVASKCGYTPQYKGLEELHKKFQSQGLMVIGFPCNQFGAQEPGTDKEIQEFCSTTYNVSFPVFAKIDVNGDKAHPLYQWLKEMAPGILDSKAIKWNFTKFLVGPDGVSVKRFAPQDEPKKLEPEIEKLLP